MTAASPAVIALFLRNEHYPSREAYLSVLVDVMKDVVVNDYPSYTKADPKRVADGIKSAVSLLLKTGGRVIGTINVNSRKPDHFTPGSNDPLQATPFSNGHPEGHASRGIIRS